MMNLIYILPKNLFSFIFGWLATREWPLFSPLFRNVFCKLYSLDEKEMLKPIRSYPSLQKLFTRKIRPESRPIGEAELVSPVDGKVSQCGNLDATLEMIQAKGKTYSLAELMGDAELAEQFVGGNWATIYLAPFNYHRIHSPVKGKVEEVHYIPGNLWPVNEWSTSRIDSLFGVNERMSTLIDTGKGKVLVCKVGALNVGRITLDFTDAFTANKTGKKGDGILRNWKSKTPILLEKGEGLGCFELGSTVVMVADSEFLKNFPSSFKTEVGSTVKMGENF